MAQDKSFIVTELRTQALPLMGRETGNLSLMAPHLNLTTENPEFSLKMQLDFNICVYFQLFSPLLPPVLQCLNDLFLKTRFF